MKLKNLAEQGLKTGGWLFMLATLMVFYFVLSIHNYEGSVREGIENAFLVFIVLNIFFLGCFNMFVVGLMMTVHRQKLGQILSILRAVTHLSEYPQCHDFVVVYVPNLKEKQETTTKEGGGV